MTSELHRGQLKKIIEHSMQLTWELTGRDTITLEDLYNIAEALKGERLTTREKQIIAGYVRRNYPAVRSSNILKIMIL